LRVFGFLNFRGLAQVESGACAAAGGKGPMSGDGKTISVAILDPLPGRARRLAESIAGALIGAWIYPDQSSPASGRASG